MQAARVEMQAKTSFINDMMFKDDERRVGRTIRRNDTTETAAGRGGMKSLNKHTQERTSPRPQVTKSSLLSLLAQAQTEQRALRFPKTTQQGPLP